MKASSVVDEFMMRSFNFVSKKKKSLDDFLGARVRVVSWEDSFSNDDTGELRGSPEF